MQLGGMLGLFGEPLPLPGAVGLPGQDMVVDSLGQVDPLQHMRLDMAPQPSGSEGTRQP